MGSVFDFGKTAETYDDFYSTDYGKKVDLLEKNLVRHTLAHVPRAKTLELGCGTGHWTRFFRHLGFNVTGVDISVEMLKIAQKRLPNVVCVKADMLDLPFPDESFDNVFAITSFEFVTDRQKAFDEAFRVLKTGGYFLIGALNANSRLGQEKDKSETFKNANFFTPESLTSILRQYGSPRINGAVVLEDGDPVDYYKVLPDKTRIEHGAFLVALVRKSLKS